jgi:hypothetical protein
MSTNGSESALTPATTPSIPETMNTISTTPEPSTRNSQDLDNEGLETIKSLQERNKWSEDQMTRMSKKLVKRSRELSEKGQEISGLKMDIELQGRHFQREIDSLEEQLGEKMEALNDKEESIGHLREELRRVKCSGEWVQVSNNRAREALEKLEAESQGTMRTLREANQMMQDRLDAQDDRMKDYHRQEARIFKLEEEIQFFDEQLMDGDIKTLGKEKSTTRYSISIRAWKLKTANKKLKSTIKKLRTKIIRQQNIITQRDEIITEQEDINENQYRDSARKLLCAKNYIAIQHTAIEKRDKDESRRVRCNKNYTAMQDAAFEKKRKDNARELLCAKNYIAIQQAAIEKLKKDEARRLLCAKNYIAIQHATIDQQNKDEARRLRCNKNYVAKQDAYIKTLETHMEDALSKAESLMTGHEEWRPEMEEMQREERERKDEVMGLMKDIIDMQAKGIKEVQASREETLNGIKEALMAVRQT